MSSPNSNKFQDQIRLAINRFILQHGYAPNIAQLEDILQVENGKNLIENGLTALADNHALVLHPNTFDIWVAHPFALFPTLFWVKSKDKKFWSNCPWCSFGLSALINDDVDIFTRLNGEEESIIIQIRSGEVIQQQYFVHFPIPAKHFWDNVIYTCSMMLIFESEAEVDAWCQRHNKPKGEVIPITTVWKLAKIWYGNYLDDNFTRKTKEIAESMFESVGLTSSFWKF